MKYHVKCYGRLVCSSLASMYSSYDHDKKVDLLTATHLLAFYFSPSGSHRIGKGQPDRIRPVAEFGKFQINCHYFMIFKFWQYHIHMKVSRCYWGTLIGCFIFTKDITSTVVQSNFWCTFTFAVKHVRLLGEGFY